MYFLNYIFMCLFIGIYLYYFLSGTPFPDFLQPVGRWVSWGFLAWAGLMSARIVVDCLLLGAKGQMTGPNVMNGILLAILNFLPVFLMSVFMLREGYK
jgi:hypothetical protein